MTVVSKMFIADKYNNTYRNTIKMKSIDVTPTSFAEKNIDSNAKVIKCF